MLVKVHYYAMLREITGKKQEEFVIENKIKFSKFLKNLADNYGDALGNKIYENHGRHRNYLIYLINGRNIHSEEGFETRLNEGDSIAIMPPVGGG